MNEQDYNAALDAIEASLAQAYLAQASELTGDISLAQITALIAAGDDLRVASTIEAAASYGATLEAMRAAYLAGGQDEAATLTQAAKRAIVAVTRRRAIFDPRRQSAEDFLKANASDTLNGLTRLQGESVQLMLTAGRERGATARQIATDILGAPSGAETRSGGVIGLAGTDAQAIINARKQLESGDPALMREYFQRQRRDRRFDKAVQKAIDAGTRLPQDTIEKAVQRYSERLLQTRAETEASIQAMETYNAGRQQLYRQLTEDGIDPTWITKQWKTRGDEKVRISHRAMSGQTQYGHVPFNAPGGIKMQNPGDSSMGAGPALIARCRCRAFYKITPATSE